MLHFNNLFPLGNLGYALQMSLFSRLADMPRQSGAPSKELLMDFHSATVENVHTKGVQQSFPRKCKFSRFPFQSSMKTREVNISLQEFVCLI